MSKPIKVLRINPPMKDTNADPNTFAKFLMIPEYKAMLRMWPDNEIHIEIHLTKDSVDSEYFAQVNNILHHECADLLHRYVLIKRK